MKKFLSFLIVITVFCWSVVAQDIGSIQKHSDFSVPEKIQGPLGDPLPAGTYSIGSGGDFPTIDSAFNKLSIDGIAGEVTLELIDNLYTAPTETFGFLIVGPIVGAGENSRVIIKPAQNHQVTIEGDGGAVLFFSNTSYVTLDGVTLTGPTSLQINSFHNSQFAWNDGIDFLNESDHNIVKNINFNSADSTRPSDAIGFWTNSSAVGIAPDSNLIENNNIVKACLAIYVSAHNSNIYGFNNIVRNNLISAPLGSSMSWGIQLEKNENTIVENNIVNNIMNSVANLELALGINAHWCNNCIIRNNVVRSVSSNIRNGSTGILLSGIAGHEGYDNMIYNNMIFDIQSTSAYTSSRVTGIQTWHNHNPKIYYNSIYLSGTGSNYMGSGALFINTNTTNVEACNNILVNTRDESPYCASSLHVLISPTVLTSDFNDLYYQPGQYNCLVRASGSDYYNLQEWQATGHDMYSISEMPSFTDLLHIDESIPNNLESGATPILGIDTDFDGDLRHPTKPDIGADEFEGMTLDTLYVPGDYTTIQAAIDAAINGNVVLVGEGTYNENINFKGKAITVASHFLVDGDPSHISNTIIDGSQPSNTDSGSVVYFISGEDTNSVLCGFTITGGTGTPMSNYPRTGGGIYISESSSKIWFNIIEYNNVTDDENVGGSAINIGIANNETTIIENNIIRNNYSESFGSSNFVHGSINIWRRNAGSIIIRNNDFNNNTVVGNAYCNGGAIAAFGYNNPDYVMIVENNRFINNSVSLSSSYSSGGAFFIQDIKAIIRNNIIAYNSAGAGGGIYSYNQTSPAPITTIIENNLIFGNTANIAGGLTTLEGNKIINCIIWGNSTSQYYGTDATITYSNLEESYSNGSNNIFSNPEIVDTTYFLLSNTSPCVDGGDPDPVFNDVEDPQNPGNPLWPAMGTLTNDIGHCGGPNSLWSGWNIPVSVEDDESGTVVPIDFTLSQNYPNPFNPNTTIKYGIPERSFVELKVYDILGNQVVKLFAEEQDAGYYETSFHASKLSSGVYFYRLQAGDFVETKKMLLLK
jgi:uncharacterized protein (UPF0218 family)